MDEPENPWYAAWIQLTIGWMGIAGTWTFGTPVLAAAGLASLLDAWWMRSGEGDPPRSLIAASAVLACAALADATGRVTELSVWMLIPAAVLALGATAACTLAVLPRRLDEFGAECGHASNLAWLATGGLGVVGVLVPLPDVQLAGALGILAMVLCSARVIGEIQPGRSQSAHRTPAIRAARSRA